MRQREDKTNKMENKNDDTRLREVIAQAKTMYQEGKYRNPEYGEICMAAVRLVEGSDFGKNKAESTLEMKVRGDPFEEALNGDFDGIAIQYLGICNDLLGDKGEVKVEPYSGGIATRSARARFEPKKE